MSVQLETSQMIDCPVNRVFHFYADEFVRNHPRWDPDIQLAQISTGPMGVGTMIRRRNTRSGTPVEGTMQVVEYERNRVFGTVIHDGNVEMHGRAVFEPVAENKTKLTISIDLPGMGESIDASFLKSRLDRSSGNIKQLIEAEV